MRNLDRIINESITEQVNRIMLREDIDRQNALCEQVLIDEGLVNGIKSMWNGLKAIGNQFKNAYAYGNEVANAQDEMKKVKNANEVIQDMAKKGIINNTIQSNWNEVLQKYMQYLQNIANSQYNGGVDYRNTRQASYAEVAKANYAKKMNHFETSIEAAKKKGDLNRVNQLQQQLQQFQQEYNQKVGRQPIYQQQQQPQQPINQQTQQQNTVQK